MRLLSDGIVVRDTYEVDCFLGEGMFGQVYRVKHKFFGRQAMKVLNAPGMKMDEAQKMLSEAIILSRIGHPNIVRVFDANLVRTMIGDCAYFTMEYVAGGTLQEFWNAHGPQFVPLETSVDILRQLCRGLSVAHGEKPPIVHRDIKPQNILVGYDIGGLRVRLSDFGLAKRVNPLTLQATALGTLRFKAPEVFRDPQSDSCAGDVWALGCTLYLLLTDRLPYESASEGSMRTRAYVTQKLSLPSSFNLQVDSRLDEIVLRALASEPTSRYADAREMLADLEKWRPAERKFSGAVLGSGDIDASKSALGVHGAADEEGAARLVKQATRLARLPGKLSEAADLMEEALRKSPALRDKYEYLIRLWRNGKVM